MKIVYEDFDRDEPSKTGKLIEYFEVNRVNTVKITDARVVHLVSGIKIEKWKLKKTKWKKKEKNKNSESERNKRNWRMKKEMYKLPKTNQKKEVKAKFNWISDWKSNLINISN